MANEKLKRAYEEPAMSIRSISFSDIIVTSTPEKEQGTAFPSLPTSDSDPWTTTP